jgi:hypothetical protein
VPAAWQAPASARFTSTSHPPSKWIENGSLATPHSCALSREGRWDHPSDLIARKIDSGVQGASSFGWPSGLRRTVGLSRPIRAREADDGGKDEDCGRLAARAGLDLGGRRSQARRSAAPPGAERVDCQGHSFFRLAVIRASSVIGPPSGPACSWVCLSPYFFGAILPASHLRASMRRAERRKASPFSW